MSDIPKLIKPEELIAHWRFRAHRMQLAYFECERVYSKYNLLLGWPTIICSTIVGSTVFAALSKGSDGKDDINLIIKIAAGFLSVTAAVLAALQTFLKYSDLSEKHRIAGGKFANLKQRIEIIAAFPPNSEEELKVKLTEIEDRWSKLRDESPSIPSRIWNQISKVLTLEKQKEKYPNLMKYNDP